MKNSTIWESASRPLSIKSVWSEAGHRHFILNHTPKQKLDINSILRNKHDAMHTPVNSNFSELNKELFLVGSSKAQFQPNFLNPKYANNSSGNTRSIPKTKHLFIEHINRNYDLLREEAPSKRSSLYDISSVLTNNSHSDEKLAERVLNWLDLAGKTPLLYSNIESRVNNVRKRAKKEQPNQNHLPEPACYRRNDSVKHITIIFNKVGVPVQLNRHPPENIDLRAISRSAGVTRRLPGNQATARLNEENVYNEPINGKTATKGIRPKTSCTSRNSKYNNFIKRKDIVKVEGLPLLDPKHQLHIFMPSLPVKNVKSEDIVCSDLNNKCKLI